MSDTKPRIGLLTLERANLALDLAAPSIEALINRQDATRKAMSIVILNPVVTVETQIDVPFDARVPEVLCRRYFGDPELDQERYLRFAMDKTLLSWKHKMSTHAIQQLYPHLIAQGEIKFGGAVYDDGIVAGGSGIQWYYDQLSALWVSAACKTVCIQAMQDVVLPDKDRSHV